jgi:predicted nucleic acid-binding protein
VLVRSGTRDLLVCDTSFVSALSRANRAAAGTWPSSVTRRARTATVAISVVTVAEMRFGHARARWGARRQHEAEKLLNSFVQFPVDRVAAEAWAQLKSQGERCGLTFGANDLWIAATGHTRGATIVTCDRDFLPLRQFGVKVVFVPRRPLTDRSG